MMDYNKYKNPAPFPGSMIQSQADRRAWSAETQRLEQIIFKADALHEVGLTGHPLADKIFEKAWDAGHHAGLQHVMDHLEDLSEMILSVPMFSEEAAVAALREALYWAGPATECAEHVLADFKRELSIKHD